MIRKNGNCLPDRGRKRCKNVVAFLTSLAIFCLIAPIMPHLKAGINGFGRKMGIFTAA
jgi:hypothetical protein